MDTAVTGVSIVSRQVSIVVGVTTDYTHLPMSEYNVCSNNHLLTLAGSAHATR